MMAQSIPSSARTQPLRPGSLNLFEIPKLAGFLDTLPIQWTDKAANIIRGRNNRRYWK